MSRFTIRDVLWLTVVVALGVAWWLDHRLTTAGRADAEAELALEQERRRSVTLQRDMLGEQLQLVRERMASNKQRP